jgi:hypothetical protein
MVKNPRGDPAPVLPVIGEFSTAAPCPEASKQFGSHQYLTKLFLYCPVEPGKIY